MEDKTNENEQLKRDFDDLQEKLLEAELNVQNTSVINNGNRLERPSIKNIEMVIIEFDWIARWELDLSLWVLNRIKKW